MFFVLFSITLISLSLVSNLSFNVISNSNTDASGSSNINLQPLISSKHSSSSISSVDSTILNGIKNHNTNYHYKDTSINSIFTLNFVVNYSFIRSSEILSYTVSPTPDTILFSWDSDSNMSSVPPAPNISQTSESHTLNVYLQSGSTWEHQTFTFTIDNTAVIVKISNPSYVKVRGDENIVLNISPSSYQGRTWAWDSNSYSILPNISWPHDGSNNLLQGEHILKVKAVDADSRTWDYSFPFFIDNQYPTIVPIGFTENSLVKVICSDL